MPETTGIRPLRSTAAQHLAWPLLALGLLLLFNIVFTPGYLSIDLIDGRLSGYLIDILRDGATIMLLALGMTLVIATGGIDLSVGAIMAIAAVVSAALVTPDWLDANLGAWAVRGCADHFGLWLVLVIAAALAASLLAGSWNGILVSIFRIQPIIATLILMIAGRGIAQLICAGQIYTYDEPRLSYLGRGTLLGLPFSLWLVAMMIAATYVLTRRTALGLMIEAVGDNDRASHYTGIRARTIKFIVYAFAGFCAGLAGLIESTNVSSANANKIGLYAELDAIFAVVVGGTALTGGRFLIAGSVVGALLIQTLTNTMYAQQVMPEIALIPKALVIVLVCLLQSASFRASILGAVRRVARLAAGGRDMKLPVGRQYLPFLAALAILAIIFIFGAVRYEDRNFASMDNVIGLFRGGAVIGIAAIGATFIIISGGIDLSVGAVIAFTTTLVATLISPEAGPGWHPLVVIPIALGAGFVFGALQGCLIHFYALPPFLVTLAGMFLARGLGFVAHEQSLGIRHPLYTKVQMASIDLGRGVDIPVSVIVLLACFALAFFVAQLTRFGREVYAVGGDETSARLMGVHVGRVKIGVYAIGGLTAALAGVVATIDMGSGSPAEFIGYELDAIASVVIGGALLTGGVGFVVGTLAGVLILGLIRLIIDNEGTLSTWWTNISAGVLLFAFISFQMVLARVARGAAGNRR